MAVSSAAFAQSSVTIYGKVDVGITDRMGSTVTEVREASGSRLGFRGTEDLGGGLKANFTLEHRFTPDNGAANDTFWNGRSIVGIEGGFGRVDMGRDYSAAFWPALSADVFGFDGVAANTAISSMGTHAVRMANVIGYTTPTMGGFKAQLSVSPKETAAKNGSSLRLNYAAGPVNLDMAVERGTTGNEWNGLNAAYDFGVARANLFVGKGERGATGDDTDAILLGLVVPMGALTLKASYGTLEVNDVKTISQLGLGARYALSKRTDVYTSFARDSKRTTEKSGWEIGLQHNF